MITSLTNAVATFVLVLREISNHWNDNPYMGSRSYGRLSLEIALVLLRSDTELGLGIHIASVNLDIIHHLNRK